MQYQHFPFFAMGTPCEIQLYAESDAIAKQTADLVIADIARLESKYSRYRDDSFLSEINNIAAVGGEITLDEESASLMDYAQTCYVQSEGLFDISSGILRQAWDFKSGRIPEQAEIDALLQRIGWNKVEWRKPTLAFSTPGMELDLGGVVKEYAVDRAVTLCHEQSVVHGLINLGGDIRVVGTHPDGKPWQVGIRNPADPEQALLEISLSAGGLASSGDYARCITLNGKRYGHVLNPLTGWPVDTLASVSVIADLCVIAGSASTIAMLKGRDGTAWLEDLGLPHLHIDTAGKVGGSLMSDN